MSSPAAPPTYDCADPDARLAGLAAAVAAVRSGRLVVLPTDTVYGVAADPFHPDGVPNVLAAKQRSAAMPPPVLVPSVRTVDGLATSLQPYVKTLIRELWPGPLTVVVQAQPSLQWDLGDPVWDLGIQRYGIPALVGFTLSGGER